MLNILKCIIAATQLSGCRAVVADRPNNPEVIVIPVSPGQGHVYVGDSWRWNPRTHSYYVSRGHWTKPRRHAVWVDGHWRQTRGGWRYTRGHWK